MGHEGGHILVFDDNPVGVRVLTSSLPTAGHEVTHSGVVDDALHACESTPFDVVLIDLEASEGSGFDFLERLRARVELAELPVVVLSADANREVVRSIAAHRVARFFVKPLDMSALLAELARLIASSDRLRLQPCRDVMQRLCIDRDQYEGILQELRGLSTEARAGLEDQGDEIDADAWRATMSAVGRVSSAVRTVAAGSFMHFSDGERRLTMEDWRAVALHDLRSLEAQIEARLASEGPSDDDAESPPASDPPS